MNVCIEFYSKFSTNSWRILVWTKGAERPANIAFERAMLKRFFSIICRFMHLFILKPQSLYQFDMRCRCATAVQTAKLLQKQTQSPGYLKATIKSCSLFLSMNKRNRFFPSFSSNTSIFTCSSVSHCQFGSDHRVRRPGVRPSPSAPHAGHTAFGWSTGKRTRSPTSALQTGSQSPAVKEKKQNNQGWNSTENPFL